MKTYGNKKSSGDWKPGGKGGYKKPSYGNKPSFGGPRKSGGFGSRPSFGGDREERPMLHSATCSKCHAACEVPFKPNGKKPIFCRDCFRKEDGGTNFEPRTSSYERPSYDRPSFEKPAYRSTPRVGSDEVAKQLNELNKKMDRILEALTDLGEDEGDEDVEGGDENAT